jgi:hypothetical protein
MGFGALFYPWGIVLQALAIVHFVRRRPDAYWLWIILFLGGLGALVYIVVEVVPDAPLLRTAFRGVPRRRRIHQLETTIIDNPAVGNLEELADLYLEEKKYARARELYDKVISPRTDSPDPFYRRGIAAIELKDFSAAVADLERVMALNPKYDFYRAMALLAHAYGQIGDAARADELFQQATTISTQSETYYNYATFLLAQGRKAEAHDWAKRILAKKPTMPSYLRRRERPWFRAAKAILKQ